MTRPALVPELYVSNLTASLAFYVDVLGFRVEYERAEDRFVALRRGAAHLMLEETPSLRRATAEEFAAGQWRPADLEKPFGRGMNLEIEVEDAAELAARLTAAGHAPLLETQPRTYRIGGGRERSVRQLLTADPDGYLIRLSQPERSP